MALCLAIAMGCSSPGVKLQSTEAAITRCPPGYGPICLGEGPDGQIICSCECESFCGSTCTNLLGDSQNCGSCGNVCPSNETCQSGVCTRTLRVAVVLTTAPSASPHPYANLTNTASVFYTPTNSMSAYSFFYSSSFHSFKLAGKSGVGTAYDVYGPFTVNTTGCASMDQVWASFASSIDFSQYDSVVAVHNDPAQCGTYGVTGGEIAIVNGQSKDMPFSAMYNKAFGATTLNGQIGTMVLHEMGHQLGLSHAAAWKCAAAPTALNGPCIGLNYGDTTDVMGTAPYGEYNPVHKEMLGWLQSGNVATATVGTNNYTLYPYEDTSGNLKVVKVPRKLDPSGNPYGYYYVVFHQPTAPWNAWLSDAPTFAQGVTIYMAEPANASDSMLIDNTPNSQPGDLDFNDAALLPTAPAFVDGPAGVTISVQPLSNNTATIQVTVASRNTRYVQVESTDDVGYAVPGFSMTGATTYLPTDTAILDQNTPGYDLVSWFYNDPQTTVTTSSNPYTFPSGVTWDTFVVATLKPSKPANDDFAKAQVITSTPFSATERTDSATVESGEPSGYSCVDESITAQQTVWFSYTAPANQQVTVTNAGSYFNSFITVFTGNSFGTLMEINNGCAYSGIHGNGTVVFNATANQTYMIQVGTAPGSSGALLDFALTSP